MDNPKERFTLRVAVYLIPTKGKKVLLSRRYQTGWMDGYYSLIAGHVDGNETLSKAMVREAYEESGIKIKNKDLIPVKAVHKKSNCEYIDFFFTTKKWSGVPKIVEPNKCDDLKWFALNKLPKNILPSVKKVLVTQNDKIPFIEFGWK